MDGDITFESANAGGAQDMFSSALYFGADPSYLTARTSDTVATDAVAGSVAIDNSKGTGWASFFQDTAKALVGYTLAKDAQQSGTVQPGAATSNAQATKAAAASQTKTLLWVAAAVGVAVLIVRSK